MKHNKRDKEMTPKQVMQQDPNTKKRVWFYGFCGSRTEKDLSFVLPLPRRKDSCLSWDWDNSTHSCCFAAMHSGCTRLAIFKGKSSSFGGAISEEISISQTPDKDLTEGLIKTERRRREKTARGREGRKKERETETDRDRETGRQREADRQTNRDRLRDRDRNRQIQRQRQRKR